jgi:DNA-3-methyladenine glycosylase
LRLARAFFTGDPADCARRLLGCELVWGACSGLVVETEAYLEHGDAACHTFRRPSARTFLAERPAGAAYVYFNYGMYWLLNVVVKGPVNGFVLLRALEPVRGVEAMRARRMASLRGGVRRDQLLCSGPGRLAQALGVTGDDHGRDLAAGRGPHFRERAVVPEIVAGPRIGISLERELPLRFWVVGNAHVSR